MQAPFTLYGTGSGTLADRGEEGGGGGGIIGIIRVGVGVRVRVRVGDVTL